jgi:hypothetical protein
MTVQQFETEEEGKLNEMLRREALRRLHRCQRRTRVR